MQKIMIPPTVEAAAKAEWFTSFYPDRNGFQFVNYFHSTPRSFLKRLVQSYKYYQSQSISISLDLFRNTEFIYGLAPGICFTALDYYFAGRPIPPFLRTNELPGWFLDYLFQRQFDCANSEYLTEIVQIKKQGKKGIFQYTENELPHIFQAMAIGLPVPITLLRTLDIKNYTTDHSVVVTGCKIGLDDSVDLTVYDPNYPGKSTHLLLKMPSSGEDTFPSEQSTDAKEPLLGFLLSNYEPKLPPDQETSKKPVVKKQPINQPSINLEGPWSDAAVETIIEDRFKYEAYAKVFVNRALDVDTPVTVGIFGEWGTGKTSLMHLIEANLPVKTLQNGAVQKIWINVWMLSSQEAVWQAFLQALLNEVNLRMSFWRRVNINKLFRQILINSYKLLLVAIPVILGLLLGSETSGWKGFLPGSYSDLAAQIGGLTSTLLALWLVIKPLIEKGRELVRIDLTTMLRYPSYSVQISELMKLQKTFTGMVETLVGKNGRLVVFIDDLDRCTQDKIPEVLEAIKLFTTTKKCVYLIGMDYERVLEGIAKHYEFDRTASIKHLEKIIQVPFFLPPLDRRLIQVFVEENYPTICRACPTASEVFAQGLESNPRRVKRAFNIFRTLIELSKLRFMAFDIDYMELELIAKMVIIQDRFAGLYNHLKLHPEHLSRWENYTSVEMFQNDQGIVSGMVKDAPSAHERPKLDAMDVQPLMNLLKSGVKRFAKLPTEQLRDYIYMVAATEGEQGQWRTGSKERDILSRENQKAIEEMVEQIHALADGDADRLITIRSDYIDRLDSVIDEKKLYKSEQRESALSALIAIESWDKRVDELKQIQPGQIFEFLEHIAQRGIDEEDKLIHINCPYLVQVMRHLAENSQTCQIFWKYFKNGPYGAIDPVS
jgi:hypothetical protein